jgi:2-phospho-L-lactate guanylyltransferase
VTLAIVVPVKSPKRAKHRLDLVMSEPERTRLATTMARDVFGVVAQLTDAARFVVSDDPEVLEEGRRFGLEPVQDRAGQGQSAAVGQGFSLAWERGYPVALTIPGDVPAVTVDELRRFAEYRREIEVLLAPDRGRIGTNGLRLTPPHAISLAFGEDSFNLHRAAGLRANRSFAVLEVEGLRYDLDTPDDVVAFIRLGRQTATLDLLRELKVLDRALAAAPPRG